MYIRSRFVGGVGLEFRRLPDMIPAKLADPLEESAVIRALILHNRGASLADITKVISILKDIRQKGGYAPAPFPLPGREVPNAAEV